MAKAEETSLRRFTTDDLPEGQRLAVWRDEFARTLVHVDVEPLSDEPIKAEATMHAIPQFRSLLFEGSAMRFNRTRAMIAAGDDSIGLIINRNAGLMFSQRGREFTLEHGEASVMLAAEPGMIAGRNHLGLRFPRAPLVTRVRNVEDAAAMRITANSDALRLLSAYLNALPRRLENSSPKLQCTVADHIYDLATLAICPDRSPDESSLSATGEARLELALAYIEKHFDSPELTIGAVALEQKISPRYLQRLIETRGVTFSEHIAELRLQRALFLLLDERSRKERISDVALRSGFSDLSNFNRSFRRRFGQSPRHFRKDLR